MEFIKPETLHRIQARKLLLNSREQLPLPSIAPTPPSNTTVPVLQQVFSELFAICCSICEFDHTKTECKYYQYHQDPEPQNEKEDFNLFQENYIHSKYWFRIYEFQLYVIEELEELICQRLIEQLQQNEPNLCHIFVLLYMKLNACQHIALLESTKKKKELYLNEFLQDVQNSFQFETLLSLKTKSILLLKRSCFYAEKQMIVEEREALQQIINECPSLGIPYYHLGQLAQQKIPEAESNIEQALEFYTKTIERFSTFPEVYYQMGMIYNRYKLQYSKALYFFNKSITLHKEKKIRYRLIYSSLLNRGSLQFQTFGNVYAAWSDFQECSRHAPVTLLKLLTKRNLFSCYRPEHLVEPYLLHSELLKAVEGLEGLIIHRNQYIASEASQSNHNYFETDFDTVFKKYSILM